MGDHSLVVAGFFKHALFLGLLLAGPDVIFGCQEPKPSQAKHDCIAVMPVVEKWQIDHDGACTTMAELRREKEISPSSKITDPWQHEYRIDCSNGVVRVSSDGPDGKPGTHDDVVQSSGLPPPELPGYVTSE